MSLKAFHILFVTLVTLLAFGFAAWAVHAWWVERNPVNLVLGVLSVICGVGLIFYFRAVRRKLKNISYL